MGASVQTAIVTSDTAVKSGPGKVYWIAVTAGATGGAFQLNDSTDDSGTDRLDVTVQASTGPWFMNFSDNPIDCNAGIYIDVPGTNLKVNVGYI